MALPRLRLGASGRRSPTSASAPGHRRRRVRLRLGEPGQHRIHFRHPPRHRTRSELGRHRGDLWARPLRGVVGQALAGLPASERPLVFTKCGMVWDPERPTAFPRRLLAPSRSVASARRRWRDSGWRPSTSISSTGRTTPECRSRRAGGPCSDSARRARSAGAASPTSTWRCWSAASAWATSILCSRPSH